MVTNLLFFQKVLYLLHIVSLFSIEGSEAKQWVFLGGPKG